MFERKEVKQCLYVKQIIPLSIDTFKDLRQNTKASRYNPGVLSFLQKKNKVVFHRSLTSYSNPFGFKSLILLNQSILRNDRTVVRFHESIQIHQILSKKNLIAELCNLFLSLRSFSALIKVIIKNLVYTWNKYWFRCTVWFLLLPL